MEYIKENDYPIGTEGNRISLDHLKGDDYRLMIFDHYSQNFIDFYLSRKEVVGLAEFLMNNSKEYQENGCGL